MRNGCNPRDALHPTGGPNARPVADGRSDADGGEEVSGEPVVARGDAAKVAEAAASEAGRLTALVAVVTVSHKQ